jgi:hypothetical protein
MVALKAWKAPDQQSPILVHRFTAQSMKHGFNTQLYIYITPVLQLLSWFAALNVNAKSFPYRSEACRASSKASNFTACAVPTALLAAVLRDASLIKERYASLSSLAMSPSSSAHRSLFHQITN